MVLPTMAGVRAGNSDPLVCFVDQLYSNDGQIESTERGEFGRLDVIGTPTPPVGHMIRTLLEVASAGIKGRARTGYPRPPLRHFDHAILPWCGIWDTVNCLQIIVLKVNPSDRRFAS